MTELEPITVQIEVNAPIETVWSCWTEPAHITRWNFASDDWCCPSAENDLREGGLFKSRMEAKDGSFGFDFEGTYTEVIPHEKLTYSFGDRTCTVTFSSDGETTTVTETFVPETENPIEMQRAGWQAILENFKRMAEGV